MILIEYFLKELKKYKDAPYVGKDVVILVVICRCLGLNVSTFR